MTNTSERLERFYLAMSLIGDGAVLDAQLALETADDILLRGTSAGIGGRREFDVRELVEKGASLFWAAAERARLIICTAECQAAVAAVAGSSAVDAMMPMLIKVGIPSDTATILAQAAAAIGIRRFCDMIGRKRGIQTP